MTAQEDFERIWRENQCGDAVCEERRLKAALAVLRGASTHVRLATIVEDHLR